MSASFDEPSYRIVQEEGFYQIYPTELVAILRHETNIVHPRYKNCLTRSVVS